MLLPSNFHGLSSYWKGWDTWDYMQFLNHATLFHVYFLWNTLTHLSPGEFLHSLEDPAQTPLLQASLTSPREGWPYTAPDCGKDHSSLHSFVKKLVSIPTTTRDSKNLEDKELILRQCLATSRCSIKTNQTWWILTKGQDHWVKLAGDKQVVSKDLLCNELCWVWEWGGWQGS